MGNLTNAQKSIWVTEQYYKGSSINNICGTAVIQEKVDFEKLKESIQIVCKKHDNFWLEFKLNEGNVEQVLSEKKEIQIDTINIAGKNQLETERNKIVKTKFTLENSKLFKFYIFKFIDGKGAFMLNIHHLISDAWTLALICNDIIKTYSELIQNKEVEKKAIYSYIDYIKSEQQYQESEKYNKDKQINIIYGDATEIDITGKYDLIFIDAAKGKNTFFFNKFKDNLDDNGTIITDNLSFHGLVEDESLVKTKNQRGIVNKIKDYINFLDNNTEFTTTYVPVGDKIAISKRKVSNE